MFKKTAFAALFILLCATASSSANTISGTILSQSSVPLSDVTVELDNITNVVKATTLTNASGVYSFTVSSTAVSYIVKPSKAGYFFNPSSTTTPTSSFDIGGVNFTAIQTYTLTGRVLKESDNTSLAGVKISYTVTDWNRKKVSPDGAYVTTDADGRYSITNLPWGTTKITPSLAGWEFTPYTLEYVIPAGTAGGATYAMQDIVGGDGVNVSGRVLDYTTRDGLDNVTITLKGKTNSGSAVSQTASTQSSGDFLFNKILKGTYTATPTKSKYGFSPQLKNLTVGKNDITDIEFLAAQGLAIYGSITLPDNDSYQDISVALYQYSGPLFARLFGINKTLVATVSPASDGAFGFLGLEAGSYTVEPSGTDYKFKPLKRWATLLRKNVEGLTFVATTGLTISGRVFNLIGIPLAEITMKLHNEADNSTKRTTTEWNGEYSFSSLVPGTYIVSPELNEFSSSLPPSKEETVTGESIDRVNFLVNNSCSATYLALPPWGGVGQIITVIGFNFGLQPTSDADVTVTLSDGTTATVAPGVYFGIDLASATKANTISWSGFAIKAEVPLLSTYYARIWVVKQGDASCIDVKPTNYFLYTGY